jgi:glycosyltransferase involved in cell wall biosynthesis
MSENKSKRFLVLSHFTRNKGTTDGVLDFLDSNEVDTIYLRHPFFDKSLTHSELLIKHNGQLINQKKYKALSNASLDLVRCALLNNWIFWKYRKTIDLTIGFGSFDSATVILQKRFNKKKLWFWGVDYSKRRSPNKYISTIYQRFETNCCLYADKIIQPNSAQLEARVEYNKLDKSKAVILANKVNIKPLDLTWSEGLSECLLYIGTIDNEHGVYELVNELYIKNSCRIPILIYGSGSEAEKLELAIKDKNLNDVVIYKGTLQPALLNKDIKKQRMNFIGLAPYSNTQGDFMEYADSLKIKEYLTFGIPYIASKALYIDKSFKQYGVVFNSYKQLHAQIDDIVSLKMIADLTKPIDFNTQISKQLTNLFTSYI